MSSEAGQSERVWSGQLPSKEEFEAEFGENCPELHLLHQNLEVEDLSGQVPPSDQPKGVFLTLAQYPVWERSPWCDLGWDLSRLEARPACWVGKLPSEESAKGLRSSRRYVTVSEVNRALRRPSVEMPRRGVNGTVDHRPPALVVERLAVAFDPARFEARSQFAVGEGDFVMLRTARGEDLRVRFRGDLSHGDWVLLHGDPGQDPSDGEGAQLTYYPWVKDILKVFPAPQDEGRGWTRARAQDWGGAVAVLPRYDLGWNPRERREGVAWCEGFRRGEGPNPQETAWPLGWGDLFDGVPLVGVAASPHGEFLLPLVHLLPPLGLTPGPRTDYQAEQVHETRRVLWQSLRATARLLEGRSKLGRTYRVRQDLVEMFLGWSPENDTQGKVREAYLHALLRKIGQTSVRVEPCATSSNLTRTPVLSGETWDKRVASGTLSARAATRVLVPVLERFSRGWAYFGLPSGTAGQSDEEVLDAPAQKDPTAYPHAHWLLRLLSLLHLVYHDSPEVPSHSAVGEISKCLITGAFPGSDTPEAHRLLGLHEDYFDPEATAKIQAMLGAGQSPVLLLLLEEIFRSTKISFGTWFSVLSTLETLEV